MDVKEIQFIGNIKMQRMNCKFMIGEFSVGIGEGCTSFNTPSCMNTITMEKAVDRDDGIRVEGLPVSC